jgi:2-dehydro-3-deoxy-D-gluconate 5-dehydrogenase
MTTSPIIPLNDLINLTGRTAVVTGGAMGIGLGIAVRLAEAGADVVLADLDGEAAATAAKDLEQGGARAFAVPTDVSDETSVSRMIAAAVERFGGVDILVNDAGIFPNVLAMDMAAADFDRVIAVNLRGVFLSAKAAAAQMIAQGRGGRIVNVTSIDALHPSTIGLAHYDASKHGAWGFTKNLALELAPHRIAVNAVAPGGIATPGVAAQAAGAARGVDMEQVLAAFLAKIPMGRMGVPDDIARAALFLASDLSSYMTGTQIVVDGGVLLR